MNTTIKMSLVSLFLTVLSGCAGNIETTASVSSGETCGDAGVPCVPCEAETTCASALGPNYSCDFATHTCGATCVKQTDCALALGPGYSCDMSAMVCVGQ